VLAARTVALLLAVLPGAGCWRAAAFDPARALGVQAQAGTVAARVRAVTGEESPTAVELDLSAPEGARLLDAFLVSLPAPPCAGGAALSRVGVDEEDYGRGPADLSGVRHAVLLVFTAPPALPGPTAPFAVDLALLAPAPSALPAPGARAAPSCLRLSIPADGRP
jgi:hypothetical protein